MFANSNSSYMCQLLFLDSIYQSTLEDTKSKINKLYNTQQKDIQYPNLKELSQKQTKQVLFLAT